MRLDQVILVNEKDQKVGLMDVIGAHKGNGTLHRAISVLLYRINNAQVELLLQKRSRKKPLWPLFWTNTICTHPRDGESYIDCAIRRLKEEMGIRYQKENILFVFQLLYQAQYNRDLSEYELDSVYIGQWSGFPLPNSEEAADFTWMKWDDVVIDIEKNSEKYTPWFKKLVAKPDLSKAIQASRS